MPNKDELVQLVIKVLRDLANTTLPEWDQVYLRNYSARRGHQSRECIYRTGRHVAVADDEPEAHGDLFDKLLPSLFDVVENESGQRPMVAVLTVTREGDYNVTFAYDDPRALEITLMALGKPSSYFKPGEVDTPAFILEYQAEMAKKGISQTPVLVQPGQDVSQLFSGKEEH